MGVGQQRGDKGREGGEKKRMLNLSLTKFVTLCKSLIFTNPVSPSARGYSTSPCPMPGKEQMLPVRLLD